MKRHAILGWSAVMLAAAVCAGEGVPDEGPDCRACRNAGSATCPTCMGNGTSYKVPIECPKCKGKIQRRIGAGAGIIFKGAGFYATDYRSDGYKKAAKAEKPSSKKDS